MPLQAGQVVHNRYQIQSQLGQGGMGAVYLAHDMVLDHRTAVKEMRPAPDLAEVTLEGLREQFKREARVLAGLNHPNLPRVTDYFTEGGNAYLVMDYVEGQSLEDVLRAQGRPGLPEAQVVDWANQLLDALGYIHGKNVLHRDIKPANIRLTPDGRVVLVDFGLVKLYDPSRPQTVVVLRGAGTPQYAPPEQIDYSYGHTDARSDLFSLGAMLYSLLSGKLPPSLTERLIKQSAIPPLRSLAPHVSPAIEAAIFKAMQLRPDDRFQSAAEMREALARTSAPPPQARVESTPALEPTYVPPQTPSQPPSRSALQPTPPPPPSYPPSSTPTPPPAASGRRKMPVWAWLGGCGCLVVALGCAAFLALGMMSPATPTPAATPEPGLPTFTPLPPATLEPGLPTSTPQPEALYSDDFSDADSGWDVYDDEDASAEYADGKFAITVKSSKWLAWANSNEVDLDDVVIEVNASMISGSEDNEFGVICRYQDKDNFYYFIISADGYAGITRMSGDDQTIISSAEGKYQQSDVVNQGLATNSIKVVCAGDNLELYANGELIAQAQDATISGGDIGLIVGTYDEGNVRIEFDDVMVSAP